MHENGRHLSEGQAAAGQFFEAPCSRRYAVRTSTPSTRALSSADDVARSIADSIEAQSSSSESRPPARICRATIAARDSYVGEFLRGRFHGEGKYVDADGGVYEGEWRQGLRWGVGQQTEPRVSQETLKRLRECVVC